MPRIKPIGSLSNWKSGQLLLRQPKVAAHKAPDYVVFEATEKRTVSKGGKAVQVPQARKTIYPEPSIWPKQVCQTSGGTGGKAKIVLRDCHVELAMVGSKHAA